MSIPSVGASSSSPLQTQPCTIIFENLYKSPWFKNLMSEEHHAVIVHLEDLAVMEKKWIRLAPSEKAEKIRRWHEQLDLIEKLMRRSIYPNTLRPKDLNPKFLGAYGKISPSKLPDHFNPLITEIRNDGLEHISLLFSNIQYAIRTGDLPPFQIPLKSEFDEVYAKYLSIDFHQFCCETRYDWKEKWWIP